MRAIIALVAAALCGCATASSTRYHALREEWQRTDVPRLADSGEHLFEGSAVLARGVLVQQVLERNPSVRAARYAWRAALARYPQVTSLDDPMLAGSLAPRSFGTRRVDDAYTVELSQ